MKALKPICIEVATSIGYVVLVVSYRDENGRKKTKNIGYKPNEIDFLCDDLIKAKRIVLRDMEIAAVIEDAIAEREKRAAA